MELKLQEVIAAQNLLKLLIVPYGIETTMAGSAGCEDGPSFNRTLWN